MAQALTVRHDISIVSDDRVDSFIEFHRWIPEGKNNPLISICGEADSQALGRSKLHF